MEARVKRTKLIALCLITAITSLFFVACGATSGKYSVSYSVQSSAMGTVTCTTEDNLIVPSGTEVDGGVVLTFVATANEGYAFEGWYDSNQKVSTSSTYTISLKGPIDLVAKFTAVTNVLTFSTNNSNYGTVSGINCQSGDSIAFGSSVTLVATPETGCNFVGWFIIGQVEPVSTSLEFAFNMPASAVSLQAVFAYQQFLLTYSFDSAKGEVSGSVDSNTLVGYQTEITLLATEKVGYDFIGWFISGQDEPVSTSAEYTFNMPANAVALEARFDVEKRTVTYYDGYDRLKVSEVDYGTIFDNFMPTKASHRFAGWYLNATLTQPYNSSALVTENITLYAKWEEIVPVYEVTFVNEDGIQIGGVQLVEENNEIPSRPKTPSKDGYNFISWVYYDETLGMDTNLSDSQTVTQDMVIRPTYEIKKVTVKFYKTEIDYTSSTCYVSNELDYGSKVTRPATPTHDDDQLIFSKWVYCVDKTLEFDFDGNITEEVELIAFWVAKPASTFTVTFFDEGENVTPLDVQIIEKGKGAIAPSDPVREGYDFVGWDTAFDKVENNLTIHAEYAIKSFTVVFKDYNGSEISNQTVEYNQSADVPDDRQRTGYDFTGWSVADLSHIKSDLEVFAEYSIKQFTVTFYNDQTVIETQENVNYNSYATIPETPSVSGYSFEGWYKDALFGEKFDFNVAITDNVNVYAKFVEIQIVTYTVTFVDGSTVISTQTVLEGGFAIAPGNPSQAGYNFVGWSADFSVVNSDLEIVAQYEKKKFTVRFFAADGVTQIGEDYLVEYEAYANAVEPEAPEIENKYHIGWDKDVNSLKIVKDTDFIAVYASETCTVTFMVEGQIYLSVDIEKGSFVNIPNTPSKIGYSFKYWYLTNENNKFDFATAINEDTVINARIDKIADIVIVTFIGADGNQYGNVQAIVKNGYAIEPAPYNDGTLTNYIWCTSDSNIAFDFDETAITEDLVLYAKEEILG